MRNNTQEVQGPITQTQHKMFEVIKEYKCYNFKKGKARICTSYYYFLGFTLCLSLVLHIFKCITVLFHSLSDPMVLPSIIFCVTIFYKCSIVKLLKISKNTQKISTMDSIQTLVTYILLEIIREFQCIFFLERGLNTVFVIKSYQFFLEHGLNTVLVIKSYQRYLEISAYLGSRVRERRAARRAKLAFINGIGRNVNVSFKVSFLKL